MVGGTTPPQSDSGEISRVLVLNLLWQSKRCSRTAQDISVLTTPSLLSRGTRPSWKRKRAGRVRAWLYRLAKKSESGRFDCGFPFDRRLPLNNSGSRSDQ